jgi:sialic acid synthase SpsE
VISTPFSEDAVAMLDGLGVDAFKIASGDLTHDPLIARAAATGRPVILSTGMSTLAEVMKAAGVARRVGGDRIAVLHCVSAYPTPVESQNLRAIATLATALRAPVGLSDHGSGLHAAIAAVALGATLYERHLVLDDHDEAIDRAVSSTPAELEAIVSAVGATSRALGDGRKVVQPVERPNLAPSRRGLYAARTLRTGERCAPADLVALRPASAFTPADLPVLVGATIRREVPAGAPLSIHDVFLARERAS